MRFFPNFRIGQKLTAITVLTSGVALLLACGIFAVFEQVEFRRTMARDFAIIADIFDDNVASGLAFNDPASIEQTLKTLHAHQRIVAACVYDQQGAILAQYRRAGASGGFEFPAARSTGQSFGADRFDTFKAIELAGEVIGAVYLGADLDELRDRAWRYAAIVAALLLGCSLVALLLASRLQRIISDPILALARTAATVATEKNYAVRAQKQSDDELGRLMDGFNEMLVQIQARDAALQRAHDELEGRVRERTRELEQEVAERRRSEEALRESHQRFEMVTQATSDVIWDRNMQTNAVWRNENFQTVFGYRPGEIEFTPEGWLSCVHPDDLPGTLASLAQTLRSGSKLWSSEYRFLRRDGTYAAILDRGHVIRDEQGQPVRMIGAMQDVTDLKRAQEEAAREHARFKFIFESVPMGISLVADDNTKTHLVNPAHERITGVSAEDSSRPGAFERVSHPDDYRRQTELAQRLIRGEVDHYSVEKRYLHPDGRAVWAVLTSRKFTDAATGVPQWVTTLVDITDRKAAEAKLVETHRQLLEISRQAGMAEVATGVLHNVGNVLNSVNVSATLVMDRARESKAAHLAKIGAMLQEHAADLAHFLTSDPKGCRIPGYLATLAQALAAEQSTMVEELDHLRKNIEHIKDIVAMQQSYAKVSGVSETVAISELVEDALRMNVSALARHGIEVVRAYEPGLTVTVERHKVLQILVNLIRNAKYACDDSFRADKRVTVRISSEANCIRIAVIDNGVGIPPENLTRVFAHGFTTRKEGHGFGLHSGALVAKELGGSLRAESDGPGRGAVFTLELPFKPEAP